MRCRVDRSMSGGNAEVPFDRASLIADTTSVTLPTFKDCTHNQTRILSLPAWKALNFAVHSTFNPVNGHGGLTAECDLPSASEFTSTRRVGIGLAYCDGNASAVDVMTTQRQVATDYRAVRAGG